MRRIARSLAVLLLLLGALLPLRTQLACPSDWPVDDDSADDDGADDDAGDDDTGDDDSAGD